MKALVWLNAVLFMLYGLGFMFFPEYLSELVTDASPSSSSGLIDMRATYGGISLGFGVLLAYMVRRADMLRLGVWAVMLIVGGMALGRGIGMVLDGSPNTMMYVFLALEVAVVLVGVALMNKHSDG